MDGVGSGYVLGPAGFIGRRGAALQHSRPQHPRHKDSLPQPAAPPAAAYSKLRSTPSRWMTRRGPTKGRSMRWLVTGGLGFIGSTFIRLALRERPELEIVNLDAMTYAGNPGESGGRRRRPALSLPSAATSAIPMPFARPSATASTRSSTSPPRRTSTARSSIRKRSCKPTSSARTSCSKRCASAASRATCRSPPTKCTATSPKASRARADPLRPRSPYSASKAGGDLQVLAYRTTYHPPVTDHARQQHVRAVPVSREAHPALRHQPDRRPAVPVYGDGLQVRDWLHVEDHARGIMHVLERGEPGNVYNIGGGNPRTNLEITRRMLDGCGRTWSRTSSTSSTARATTAAMRSIRRKRTRSAGRRKFRSKTAYGRPSSGTVQRTVVAPVTFGRVPGLLQTPVRAALNLPSFETILPG